MLLLYSYFQNSLRLLYSQAHKYLFVSRSAKFFTSGLSLVYLCSCSIARSGYIQGLSTHINGEIEDINDAYPECYHIKAVVTFVQDYIDGPLGLTPEYYIRGMILKADLQYDTSWQNATLTPEHTSILFQCKM